MVAAFKFDAGKVPEFEPAEDGHDVKESAGMSRLRSSIMGAAEISEGCWLRLWVAYLAVLDAQLLLPRGRA